MKNLGVKGKNVSKKSKPEPDDKEQSQRFVDAAKELGVDESGGSFDRALGVVTPTPKAVPVRSDERKGSR